MVRGKWLAILLWAASLLCAVAPAAHAVSSAELYTSTSYRYGRYEARLQFPPADGVVGSFFLWKEGSELAGSYWNELDYEKVRGDCTLQLNSIYGRPQAGHETLPTGVTGLCTGYHSYVFEWTPDHIAWLVDGVELRRDTGAAAQAYAANATDGMQLRFNIWPGTPSFGGTFSPASLPQYLFISWVAFSSYDGVGDTFELAWRESFEAARRPFDWATATWGSPLQQSTHTPANITFVDGVAVLSLTADDATGFAGTPPQDPGEQPTEHISPGTAGAGGSGGGSATGTGGTSGQPAAGGSPGCPACAIHDARDSALAAFGATALLAVLLARSTAAAARPDGGPVAPPLVARLRHTRR